MVEISQAMSKASLLFAFLIVFLGSCRSSWDEEAQTLFHQGCMEAAKEQHMSEKAAQSMCDCRLEKVMAKYPDFADALEHANEMANDAELKACK